MITNLTSDVLKSLHDIAVRAVLNASEILVSYDRNNLNVNEKEGASSLASGVVTEVDLLCQESIVKDLLPSIKKYDFALLTEETADDHSRFEKDYFWCVDPIDGTLPFIENRPGYSIVISLVSKEGDSFIGVIFDPVERIVYSAIRGMGAFKNNLPWTRNINTTPSKDETLALVFDRSFYTDKHYPEVVASYKEYAKQSGFHDIQEMQYGGAAMNAIWLAQHEHGCYLKFPKEKGGSIWDYAASNCIYKELKLPVSNIYGDQMDLNRKDSTYMNHMGILFATDESLKKWGMEINRKLNKV